jgi:hypothetical protein
MCCFRDIRQALRLSNLIISSSSGEYDKKTEKIKYDIEVHKKTLE